MKERYKEAMIAGKGAYDHLFGENDTTGKGAQRCWIDSGNKLPLEENDVVLYEDNGQKTQCTIKEVISQEGSCSIIYLVKVKTGNLNNIPAVLKEFCPKGMYNWRYRTVDKEPYQDVSGKTIYNGQLGPEPDSTEKNFAFIMQKFKDEPERLSEMHNPNENPYLLKPFSKGCFTYHNNLYWLSEHVKGKSLFEYVKEKGKTLQWEQKCSIMSQLCDALSCVHKKSVHQDVTPYNIMISEDNGQVNVKLIDLGLATNIGHQPNGGSFHTHGTDVFTDTTSYNKSYEKLYSKDAEAASPGYIKVLDIYSLGMIWLYLLQSDKWEGKERGLMMQDLKDISTEYDFQQMADESVPEERGLQDIMRRRKAYELARISIDFDATKKFDGNNPYGPFQNRPKTVDEWLERFSDMVDSSVECNYESEMNVPVEGLQDKVLQADSNSDEMIVVRNSMNDDAWFELYKEGNDWKITVHSNEEDKQRELHFYVVHGSEVKRFYKMIQEAKVAENRVGRTAVSGTAEQAVIVDTDWQEEGVAESATAREEMEPEPVHTPVVDVTKPEDKLDEKVDRIKIVSTHQGAFNAKERDYKIHIKASGPWTAEITPYKSWVTVKRKELTDEGGSVTVHVSQNDSVEKRQGTRLLVRLDGKPTVSDNLLLAQEGIGAVNPVWEKVWQGVRKTMPVWIALFLLVGGYGAWWWFSPTLTLQDEPLREVTQEGEVVSWDFKTKYGWQAEVVEGAFVTLDTDGGDAGSHVLQAKVLANNVYSNRTATVRITCQDKSVLLEVRQTYDKADSLNFELSKFRERWQRSAVDSRISKPDLMDLLLKLDNQTDVRGVFRLSDGTAVPGNSRVVKGEAKDCQIGVTHKVIDFQKDEETGVYTRIVLEPIK